MHRKPAEKARRTPKATPLVVVATTAALLLVMFGSDPPEGTEALEVADRTQIEPLPAFEMLDRMTGVTAIVLTESKLELIDLDTAARNQLPIEDPIRADSVAVGRRMLALGDKLIVPNGTEVWSIDLSTGVSTDLGSGDRVASSFTPGYLWIRSEGPVSWTEIDASGARLRSLQWPANGIPWDYGFGSPEVAVAPGGGIYRLQDDSTWAQAASGTPLAGNKDTALVEECSSLSECETSWVDLTTGLTTERWIPPTVEDKGGRKFRLSPAGHSLIEITPTNRTYEEVFAYGDGVVRGTACHQGWRTASWSPDESLLACVTNRGLAVSDLDNGPAALINDWDDPPLAVVLIETALLGS